MSRRLLSRRKLLGAVAVAIALTIANIPATPGDPHAAEWRDGDIVCLNGRSMRSRMVRLLQGYSSDYSHVGIVVLDNDVPFVVHADPACNKVIKQRWDMVVAPGDVTGGAIFRVRDADAAARATACESARRWAAAQIPFDNDFSLDSADRLFCTELVWRAYRAGGIELCADARQNHPHLLPADLLTNRLQMVIHF